MGRPATVVAALNAQAVTTFVVYKTITPSGNGGCLVDLGIDDTGNFMLADGNQVGSFADSFMKVPNTAQSAFSTLATSIGSYTNGTGTFPLERWHVDGGCVGHASSASAGPGATVSLCIGANANNGAFINCEADIYEILFWDQALTPTEVMQAHMWACEKYGQSYPWASRDHMLVFDGDSITMGLGGSSPADSYPYKVAQTLGLSFGQWTNLGIGGDTITEMDTRAPAGVDDVYALIGKPVKLAAFEWYNQRAASPTPRNNSLTYLSNRRSSTVKVCFGTSTDTSATTDTDRADYNTYFDANNTSATMDAYVAIHADANIGVETAAANFPGNFADGVHLSAAGYTILAGLMVTGVNALVFAPTINTQPANLSVYENALANFTIAATASSGTNSYQWKKNGVNVGTDSTTLSFTAALSDNAALITCDVTDDNGTVTSSTATLTVIPSSIVAWMVA